MDITKYALNLSPLLMQQVTTGAVTVKYVPTLPESGAENIVYLVPDGDGGHLEYIWNGSDWVIFGSTNGQGRLGMRQEGEYLVIDQAPGLPRDSYTKEQIDSILTGYTTTDTAHDNRIKAIEDDYLKGADRTELQKQITANANAITLLTDGVDPVKVDGVKDLIEYVDEHGTEVTGMQDNIASNANAISAEVARAEAAEEALDGRVDTLEASKDAYVAADTALKTELQAYTDSAKSAAVETAKRYADKTVDNNTAPPIVQTASGEVIAVHDSAARPLKGLRVFGKTETYLKNFFPYDKAISTTSFITFNADKTFTIPSLAAGEKTITDVFTLPIGEYKIGINYLSGARSDCYFHIYASNGSELAGTDMEPYFELAELTEVYGVLRIGDGGEEVTGQFFITDANERVVEFSNVGDTGSVNVTITDGDEESQTLAVLTPDGDGLRGLDISEYRDYVDFGNGKLVQWFDTFTFDGTEGWGASSTSFDVFVAFNLTPKGLGRGAYTPIVSNYFPYGNKAAYTSAEGESLVTGNKTITVKISKSKLGVDDSATNSSALPTWKARLAEWAENGVPLYVISERTTPIETPLTAEQIEAFKDLRSYYPNTTITNDSGAHMEVEYVADTKLYIDGKFAELSAAILNQS